MTETVDIVGSLISQVVVTVPFKTIVDNGDNTYTITSCDTGYLFPNYTFSIGGVNYTVLNEVGKEFVYNVKFTIKGNIAPSVSSVTLNPLQYESGTIIATKQDLKLKDSTVDKFPMAYLHEKFKDEFDPRVQSPIDRKSSIKLFFLCETNGYEWNTKQHKAFAIKPMRNFLYKFISHLEKNSGIGELTPYGAEDHTLFGIYVDSSGHTRRLFDDKLSGVELTINLPIKKSSDCLDCNH